MKIIKIGSGGCGPCKVQDKELDKLDGIEINKYDAEENEDIVDQYNIRNIPVTIILDDDNNEVKRWNGLVKATEIQKYI